MADGDTAAAPLGIIAGAGRLPIALAEAVRARGREVFIVGFTGFADDAITAFPHVYAKLGQAGLIERALKRQGCREVVMVGQILRPRFSQIRFDLGILRIVPMLPRYQNRGDDAALRVITGVFEQAGFKVLAPSEVAPELVVPEGVLGRHAPSADDEASIRLGFDLLRAIGPYDVGQGVVLHRRRILAVEGAEGTDDMLARVRALREAGRLPHRGPSGLLVKGPKPQQELRNDMPVIGRLTVEGAVAAGLAGIAVAANRVILVDWAETIAAADVAGLFLVGVPPSPAP